MNWAWINVFDDLPADFEARLVYVVNPGDLDYQAVAYWNPRRTMWCLEYGGTAIEETVTHWMPLPEGPKK